MKTTRILAILLIVITLVLSACSPTASPTPSPPTTQTPTRQTATPSVNAWIDQINRAWVVAHSHNWDADAEDDGLRVWVELQDTNENMIEYTEVNMPVSINIYSTESVTYPWKPARIVHSNSGSLTNWDDDAFVTGAKGIKDINWEEISPALPSEQQEYGIIHVEITLPDGRLFSAQYDEARIEKP